MASLRVPAVAPVVALAAGLMSCTADPAPGIMVAMATDMALPDDVSSVGLRITSEDDERLGSVIFEDIRPTYEAESGRYVEFPATFAVVPGDRETPRIRVRVVAFRGEQATVMRNIVTTIPLERVALLRIAINLASEGGVEGTLSQANATDLGNLRSTCPSQEESNVAGRCIDNVIAEADLPDYDEATAFGGGVCFPVAECLQGYEPLALDLASCSAPAPAESDVNFALERAETFSQGAEDLCIGEGEDLACFSVIEPDAATGWTVQNGQVLFAPGVCQAITDGRALSVVGSNACGTKSLEVPVCAPWGGSVDRIAPGGPGGLEGIGGAPGEGGAGQGGAGQGGAGQGGAGQGGVGGDGQGGVGGSGSGGAPSYFGEFAPLPVAGSLGGTAALAPRQGAPDSVVRILANTSELPDLQLCTGLECDGAMLGATPIGFPRTTAVPMSLAEAEGIIYVGDSQAAVAPAGGFYADPSMPPGMSAFPLMDGPSAEFAPIFVAGVGPVVFASGSSAGTSTTFAWIEPAVDPGQVNATSLPVSPSESVTAMAGSNDGSPLLFVGLDGLGKTDGLHRCPVSLDPIAVLSCGLIASAVVPRSLAVAGETYLAAGGDAFQWKVITGEQGAEVPALYENTCGAAPDEPPLGVAMDACFLYATTCDTESSRQVRMWRRDTHEDLGVIFAVSGVDLPLPASLAVTDEAVYVGLAGGGVNNPGGITRLAKAFNPDTCQPLP